MAHTIYTPQQLAAQARHEVKSINRELRAKGEKTYWQMLGWKWPVKLLGWEIRISEFPAQVLNVVDGEGQQFQTTIAI